MNQEYFKTFDLGTAAALMVYGYELDSLVRDNPRKVEFVFRKDGRKKGISDIVEEYFADKLEVPALSFFNAIKTLKNRIYSSE